MLKKRIIPILLLNGKRMVKGKKFSNYRDTGHPIATAKVYNSQKVDELIFLDINPSDDINILINIIKEVSEECFMPLTVGGGIRKFDDVKKLIESGADKISLNSIIYESPFIIEDIAKQFGIQSIVISIDVKYINGRYICFSNSGKQNTNIELKDILKEVENRGAGEVLITNIDREGMMKGYDLDLIQDTVDFLKIPVIANGGVGKLNHFLDAFKITPNLSAVASSSIYHFTDQSPIKVRSYLLNNGIELREI